MSIPLKSGLCVDCNDGVLKPVIGKREKARCVNHYNNRWRAKSGPIAKKSDNRIEEDKIYFPVKDVFILDNKYCLAKLNGCQAIASEVHHTKGHDQYYLDIYTWLPVCSACHRWLEVHPTQAKLMGLSQDRLNSFKIILPFKIEYERSILKFRELTAA